MLWALLSNINTQSIIKHENSPLLKCFSSRRKFLHTTSLVFNQYSFELDVVRVVASLFRIEKKQNIFSGFDFDWLKNSWRFPKTKGKSHWIWEANELLTGFKATKLETFDRRLETNKSCWWNFQFTDNVRKKWSRLLGRLSKWRRSTRSRIRGEKTNKKFFFTVRVETACGLKYKKVAEVTSVDYRFSSCFGEIFHLVDNFGLWPVRRVPKRNSNGNKLKSYLEVIRNLKTVT